MAGTKLTFAIYSLFKAQLLAAALCDQLPVGDSKGVATMDGTIRLRSYLKERTAARHDRLDAVVSHAGFADPDAYCDFLVRQFAARSGMEQWAAVDCPADLAPPPACELLAEDIASLSCAIKHPRTRAFTLPDDADPIGFAWAIAGSHMGNLVIRKQVLRDLPGASVKFLSDERMRAFWGRLRPILEAEVPIETARRAARAADAVFDAFLDVFANPDDGKLAA